ncbi:MAG: InlB B-repeat-containing protein [Lachnospiraceae bacterium]|nr:InlB B-repeat-containing protein [Lachnospiraceae bacterium]
MGAFKGNNKLKIFGGSTKVKKAYLGDTKIYSSGNIVTYYVDNSTYYQEEVDSDASCLNPVTFTPSKSGWEFVGWREDTTASSSVLSGKIMGDEPVTLYAVFKQAVTLYYYNGSATKQNKSDYRYYNNGNIVNPSFVMSQTTASGWTARGWATGTAGNASVAYSNGATITISADTTIYGLYQQTITLTYYNNSTTKATTIGTRYWNSGSNAYVNPTFTLSQASKSGWTARGWATGTAGNASVAYSSISNTAFNANTTIYGLYYKTCTLTAKSYNSTQTAIGTAYYNSAGITINATCTVPSGSTYSGWSWRGWGTSTGASASVSYANGATYALGTGDATIYGLYSQTIYLYYNGNSATSGSVSTQSGTRYWNAYGNYSNPTFTLASNGFSRTYYTFTGWDLGAVGATVTLSVSTTACAQWVQSVSNFGYTGGVQSFTAPVTGTYQLEVWGAQGGNAGFYEYANGGLGGYSKGNVSLSAGQTIYVVVGGQGGLAQMDTSIGNEYHTVFGGYNGGATGVNSWQGQATWSIGAGGGGATHIGTFNNTLSGHGSTSGLYIVAGGGGGASLRYGWEDDGTGVEEFHAGGTGGGTNGGVNSDNHIGGTQSSAAEGGGFGYGGKTGASGGGGGLYGGGGTSWAGCSGSGGSGYIGGVSSGYTTNGQRSGNGYATITLL